MPIFWSQPGLNVSLALKPPLHPNVKPVVLNRPPPQPPPPTPSPNLKVGQHRVHLTREYEASQPAFDRHVNALIDEYGKQAFVSLLNKKTGENILNSLFERHVEDTAFPVEFHAFDVHAAAR